MASPDPGPWQREYDTDGARAPAGAPASHRSGPSTKEAPAKGRLVEAVGA